jgi:lipopolysaccharide/colanic/teichoic acid biosynthesis glycosyltransferase
MIAKRIFDFLFSFISLLLSAWFIILLYIIACIDTRGNGLFVQVRIGQYAKPFRIYKLTTINPKTGSISAFGRFLRKYKLDELPQLFNVLMGSMSMVGPRPDVPGYYDMLVGEDRVVLKLKPGLTGPASIKYANEEELLASRQDPLKYNDDIIFPDKVEINKQYYKNRSFAGDLKIIIRTIWR